MEELLTLLESMTPAERKWYLQLEVIRSEEEYLNRMIHTNKELDELATYAIKRSKQCLEDYTIYKDSKFLQESEEWLEIAKDIKLSKYTIKDFREQREHIQWEKKQLQLTTKQKNELS